MNMKKLIVALGLMVIPSMAIGQGGPGGGGGPGPVPNPWIVNGGTVNPNGLKVLTAPSTTGQAGFNLPAGVAPMAPVNGDVWITSAGTFARVNGVSQQFAGVNVANTFTQNQVIVGNLVNVIPLTSGSVATQFLYGSPGSPFLLGVSGIQPVTLNAYVNPGSGLIGTPVVVGFDSAVHISAGTGGGGVGAQGQCFYDGSWGGTNEGTCVGVWGTAVATATTGLNGSGQLGGGYFTCINPTGTVAQGCTGVEIDRQMSVSGLLNNYGLAINDDNAGTTSGTLTINGSSASVVADAAILIQAGGGSAAGFSNFLLTVQQSGNVSPMPATGGVLWRAGGFSAKYGLYWPDMSWPSDGFPIWIGNFAQSQNPIFAVDYLGDVNARNLSLGTVGVPAINTVNAQSGGFAAVWQFLSVATVKWTIGKQSDDSWYMQDATSGLNFMAVTTGGATTIGESGSTVAVANFAAAGVVQSNASGVLSTNATLSGALGGTGVANTGKTITLGGNLTTSGAFASTFTMTGITAVTFPTSGTLATTAGNVATASAWATPRLLAGNSVDGSANVAFANKFIAQGTADSGLSGAQFLGALGTGLVKNTTTTGVLSIAAAGTDYAPATSGSALLLGNGAGGFSSYAGASACASSGLVTAISSTGTTTCATNAPTATTAGTVTTAAQPSITSVGTLTSLTTSGLASLAGVEGAQLSWQIASSGQQWKWNLNAGGTLYLIDATNSKIPLQFGPNTTAAITVSGSTVALTGGISTGGNAGVTTVCTETVGNTLTFTNGILTTKGANCT